MFEIRHATEADIPFWRTLDGHISEGELRLKLRDGRAYVVCDGGRPAGVLRYNLFWDIIPFLTLIHFEEASRGKGLGRKAMQHWEAEMRAQGRKMLMTSTQADEEAQHFYRKLGYMDKGALFLDGTPHAQAPEIFLVKVL